jgi:hypothetical protein
MTVVAVGMGVAVAAGASVAVGWGADATAGNVDGGFSEAGVTGGNVATTPRLVPPVEGATASALKDGGATPPAESPPDIGDPLNEFSGGAEGRPALDKGATCPAGTPAGSGGIEVPANWLGSRVGVKVGSRLFIDTAAELWRTEATLSPKTVV